MVRGSGIAELEFRNASRRIRVTNARDAERRDPRAGPDTAGTVPTGTGGPGAAPLPDPSPPAVPHVIKSPRVGTLHRAGAPGTRPFVEAGDLVEAGRTLCVIEAMKLRSEVVAARAGIVASALVEDGQPVEYGQPLFVIA